MPASISFNKDRSQARLVVEPAPGDTLAFGAPYTAVLESNEFQLFQNVVVRRERAWRLRQGFGLALNGADLTAGTSTQNRVRLFPGTLRGGATKNPYYIYDVTNGDIYAQFDASSAATTVATDHVGGSLNTWSPGEAFAQDLLFTASPLGNTFVMAGTVHSMYTGTATLTSSSATVSSISPALSASEQTNMVGSLLTATNDSLTTSAVYRIKSVDSATQVTLDVVYAGSDAGASKSIRIAASAPTKVSPGVFSSSNNHGNCKFMAERWGRVIRGFTYEALAFNSYRGNRIRWSGIADSDEGTTPFLGVNAYHADGYLDLPGRGGDIVYMTSYSDALVVFQKRLMTVLYGAPTFDGEGSLDASTTFRCSVPDGNAVCATPYGLYFYDAGGSIKVWTGQGEPRSVSPEGMSYTLVTSPISYMGYYSGYLVMSVSGSTTGWLHHIPTGSWSKLVGSDMDTWRGFTSGRGSLDGGQYEHLVTLDHSLDKLIDVGAPLLFDDVGAPSDGGGTRPTLLIETDVIAGEFYEYLRPRRLYATYELEDDGTDPTLDITVYTSTESSEALEQQTVSFPLTSAGITTKEEAVNVQAAPGVLVRITHSGQTDALVVRRIVVECDVERVGDVV